MAERDFFIRRHFDRGDDDDGDDRRDRDRKRREDMERRLEQTRQAQRESDEIEARNAAEQIRPYIEQGLSPEIIRNIVRFLVPSHLVNRVLELAGLAPAAAPRAIPGRTPPRKGRGRGGMEVGSVSDLEKKKRKLARKYIKQIQNFEIMGLPDAQEDMEKNHPDLSKKDREDVLKEVTEKMTSFEEDTESEEETTGKGKMVSFPKKEFVAEHKKLIRLLKDTKDPKLIAERKSQAAELKQRVGKGKHSKLMKAMTTMRLPIVADEISVANTGKAMTESDPDKMEKYMLKSMEAQDWRDEVKKLKAVKDAKKAAKSMLKYGYGKSDSKLQGGMKWIDALKVWNKGKGGSWCIPKKGSADYDAVRAIMERAKPEAVAARNTERSAKALEQLRAVEAEAKARNKERKKVEPKAKSKAAPKIREFYNRDSVKKEFEDLWAKLGQSPTVRQVPGGFGMFYEDTEVLRGPAGDMFERYVRGSSNKELANLVAGIVKSYSKKAGEKPYILEEDFKKIQGDVFKKLV